MLDGTFIRLFAKTDNKDKPLARGTKTRLCGVKTYHQVVVVQSFMSRFLEQESRAKDNSAKNCEFIS